MHEQHIKWQHDHEAWLADIDEWKKELGAALTNLTDLEALLRDSLDGMETHANTVWEAQQRIKAHEAIISEESRDGENKTDKEWETTHKELSSQHEHVFEVHERIKKYHHRVTAKTVRLLIDARKGM
jgi:DNA repair ATPase RecN